MPDAAIGAPQPVPLTIDGARGTAALEHRSEVAKTYLTHLEHLRDSPYLDYPNQVGIETHASCNASCNFCPYTTLQRQGDRMPDALLAKVLRELEEIPRDLPFDINLARVNEPFLDKRIFDLVIDVNERLPQASLWMFTNASPLVPKVAQRLSDWRNVTQFVVSFNEHRANEYQRVMRIPFERTVSNLDHLHKMHHEGDLSFTPTISKVGDGTTADDEFLEWVMQRWPSFRARVTDRFDWFDGAAGTRMGEVPNVGCWQWFHLPILAAGRVAYCCLDHEGDHAWGDANERHILDIYNQPERRALRMRIPDRHEVEACRECSHYG